jgi:hypothetical protein
MGANPSFSGLSDIKPTVFEIEIRAEERTLSSSVLPKFIYNPGGD